MTREEIVAYRPGQDPEFDPSAGRPAAPPAPPKPAVMSTADIAAYRPGEDPAYDPVERRGWWDVNIARGSAINPWQVLDTLLHAVSTEHFSACEKEKKQTM